MKPPKPAYVAFAINGDGIDTFCIKLADPKDVKRVFKAITDMRYIGGFVMKPKDEDYRTSYVNTGCIIELCNWDYTGVSLDLLKQVVKELFFTLGYEILFISYNKIINLKKIYK